MSRFAPSVLLALGLTGCATDPGREGVNLFPLYRNVDGADASEVSVLWPLTNFEREPEKSANWFFPFFLHTTEGKDAAVGELTLVPFLPLWMERRTLDEDYTHLAPLWSKHYAGGRTDQSLLLFLVNWSRQTPADELVAHSLFPLYQWVAGGPGNRLSLIRFGDGILHPTEPLFSLLDIDHTGVRREKDQDVPATRIDFGGVVCRLVNLFHTSDDGAFDETRVVTLFANETWSWYYHVAPHEGAPGADHDDGATITRLFPLFSRRESRGSSEWSALFWMFGAKEEAGQKSVRVFWIPFDL